LISSPGAAWDRAADHAKEKPMIPRSRLPSLAVTAAAVLALAGPTSALASTLEFQWSAVNGVDTVPGSDVTLEVGDRATLDILVNADALGVAAVGVAASTFLVELPGQVDTTFLLAQVELTALATGSGLVSPFLDPRLDGLIDGNGDFSVPQATGASVTVCAAGAPVPEPSSALAMAVGLSVVRWRIRGRGGRQGHQAPPRRS
jgi:hypothetical protein